MEYIQLEFDFSAAAAPEKKKRNYVDYEAIYEELKWRPLTFNEIKEMAGVTVSGAAQVITTLTLNYPVWSPKKGVYKLCEESDYATRPSDWI